MGIAILVLVSLVSSILIQAIDKSQQNRRAARQHQQPQDQHERFLTEWRRAQAQAKAESARIGALEREQERQRREQERQAKEQARQAEQLAKHEAQIAALEFKMTQAEADIAAESERISALYALLDLAAADQAAAIPGSKADERAQRKIISLNAQIHAAEKRKAKAEFTKQTAQQKLAA